MSKFSANDFDQTNKNRLGLINKTKSGRPKKDPNKKLSNRLQISFTNEEWQQLNNRAEDEDRHPSQLIKRFLILNNFFK
jgi:hypothetical protein